MHHPWLGGMRREMMMLVCLFILIKMMDAAAHPGFIGIGRGVPPSHTYVKPTTEVNFVAIRLEDTISISSPPSPSPYEKITLLDENQAPEHSPPPEPGETNSPPTPEHGETSPPMSDGAHPPVTDGGNNPPEEGASSSDGHETRNIIISVLCTTIIPAIIVAIWKKIWRCRKKKSDTPETDAKPTGDRIVRQEISCLNIVCYKGDVS